MKTLCFIVAGALAFSACKQEVNQATTGQATTVQNQNGKEITVKTVGPEEAKTLLETRPDLVILDVRTPEEFAGGHLKNALLLNKYDPEFETKIKGLDKDKQYLVYCASGGRSGQTKTLMQELGFTRVYDAKGFEALKNAGVPVE